MNGRIFFDPIIPAPFVLLLGLALFAATVWVYSLTGSRLSRWQSGLLLALRLGGVLLVLLLLLQPSRREEIAARKSRRVLLVGLDTSRSMDQADSNRMKRLDAAREIIRDASLTAATEDSTVVQFFSINSDATAIPGESLAGAKAEGDTTRLHRSITTMLDSVSGEQSAAAIILLSDGHDFELVNPVKTALLARARHAPIYAVALGDRGRVRDVSVHITSFEPYSYVHQKARIAASLRLIGCEHENLSVELMRGNRLIKSTQVNAGEQMEIPVDFEVTEAEIGQFEYEVRARPLAGEIDPKNNSAITFLNVIDQRIRVLLLEGSPYWDTTFLQRSLFQNDKIDLDAVIQYTRDKARRLRKADTEFKGNKAQGEFELPAAAEEFNRYDVIVLGKSVDHFLSDGRMKLLESFVKDHGGTVIFSRGKAFEGEEESELEPVVWADQGAEKIRVEVSRDGRSSPPFRMLADAPGGTDALPPVIAARQISDRKMLATLLAQAHDPESGGGSLPAVVHRRYGRGQILSIAVDGLWKWSFNPKARRPNNIFDRFWDQLILWLTAGSDFMPSQQFAFRASTANLILGSKLHFRLAARDPQTVLGDLPVTIFYEDQMAARTALTPLDASDKSVLTAEYLPEKPGRYRAVVKLPEGREQEVKWMVFEDNPEEKEVAVDTAYLRTLCETAGGSLVSPEALPEVVRGLRKPEVALNPKVRFRPIWDHAWVFGVICGVLALDWHLRRRWGLC